VRRTSANPVPYAPGDGEVSGGALPAGKTPAPESGATEEPAPGEAWNGVVAGEDPGEGCRAAVGAGEVCGAACDFISSRRNALSAVLAAGLIIGAGVVFFATPQTLDLANAVEECHSAYVHRLTAPEFSGLVPDKIAQQFAGQLDAAAFAYLPSRTTFSSGGARLYHVEGVPVALILGHSGPTPVSMIVLKKAS
jgi:hypothetical protein